MVCITIIVVNIPRNRNDDVIVQISFCWPIVIVVIHIVVMVSENIDHQLYIVIHIIGKSQ